MNRFLSFDFLQLVALVGVLVVVHEAGHYLAYRTLGIRAKLRRSLLLPGIDPVETVTVSRWKGIWIALGGFLFAGVLINLPAYLLSYRHSFVLLLGGLAGSIVDFIWAISMLGQKTVVLRGR